MDYKLQFDELKSKKRSKDLIEEVNTLFVSLKEEKNSDLTMEVLLYLSESYRALRMHEETIELLEEEINSDYFETKEERIMIIDDLVKTLLRTEDFIKLKSVLFTRERFLTNEHQKIMQKFYYAVCYEGMKENKKAIEYLLEIKDNISSSNLVSKYLKLSMLYIKENKLDLAKENFEKACKFDTQKKNPIFYLTESDILFLEKDYLNSLNKYQEYFIRSKNKRRYLDRYILINIKLNRYDEAWRFYQEYIPVMKNLISKNYRLIFYEAAITLAKQLNNISEIEKLNYLINELTPKRPIMNQFDNVYQLLSIAFKQVDYHKERDIIYHMFKAIDSLYQYQKLLYIKKQDNQVIFYHYSKGLLLEKAPKITDINNTLIEDILKKEVQNDLYTYDDLIKYRKSVYKDVETQYFFVNGIKRENSFDYFCVYSKEKPRFDFQQKLLLIAHQILLKEIQDFDALKLVVSNFQNYKKLLDNSNFGLIKIEKGIIHLLNDNAKNQLSITQDYVNFEVFQNQLKKKVFLDDFLYTNEMDIIINKKSYKLYVTKEALTIYIIIKELKEGSLDVSKNCFIELPNETKLLEDLKNVDPKTILFLDIRNYYHFFKNYNYEAYKEMLVGLIQHLKTLSRTHFSGLYLNSFNQLYLVIKTTDKRVISRIIESLYKIDTDLDIRTSVIQINHNLDFDQLIKLRYLNSLTSKEQPFINDNKNFRYNMELAKTLMINIKNLIHKKEVPLHYQGIGDWHNKRIDMMRVLVSDQALLGEVETLKRVLRSENLEREWDTLIINSLVNGLKDSHYLGRIMVNLSNETLKDIKHVKKLIKKLESTNINADHFVIDLDLSKSVSLEKIETSLNFLKDKGYMISIRNFNEYLNIEKVSIFKYASLVIIDIEDTTKEYYADFIHVLKDDDKFFILNHKNKTITKKILEKYDIKYVEGSMYPKYESVNGLL